MSGIPYGDGKKKPAGTWDYFGGCSPDADPNYTPTTFSFGIFQWVRKTSGKDVKRSKVHKRIYGKTSDPQPAIDRALAIVIYQNKFPGFYHPDFVKSNPGANAEKVE